MNPTADEINELVAYLDGELDEESSRRLEQRLAGEPALAEELRRLESAWQALDTLPRIDVDEEFTQSTVALIARAAEQDVSQVKAQRPRRLLRQRLFLAGGALAAAAAGFLVLKAALPDPNAALLKDLPVLTNLDQYRRVEDVEFLRLLSDAGLFVEGEGSAPVVEEEFEEGGDDQFP